MVNKYGNIDPQAIQRAQLSDLPRVEAGSHQERVYNEMFKAIEMLGRKLDRSETERERLSRRLSLIESSATVDEKTGRLFLPALLPDGGAMHVSSATPRWAVATSGLSMCVAVFALWLAFSSNNGTALTPQQLAVIDALANNHVASLDTRSWQQVETKPEDLASTEPTTPLTSPVTAPDDSALPQPTLMADAQAPAATEDTAVTGATESAAIEPALGDATQAVDHTELTAPGFNDTPDTPDALAQAVDAEEKIAAAKPETKTPVVVEKPAVAVVEEKQAAAPVVAEKKAAPVVKEPASGAAAVYSRIPADKNLPADIALLEKRAAEDVPEAQHDLATLYAAGKAVPQDYKRAVYWFSRAADGGIANAHYNLGVMFQQGLGVKKDVKKAVRWYKSAAELGHPEAMYNLGISYIEGIGTPRDIEKGAAYFRRAANAGVAQAAYNLGVLYESSFLGAADIGQAMEWYRKAGAQGHAEANASIARLQQAQAQAMATKEPAAGNP